MWPDSTRNNLQPQLISFDGTDYCCLQVNYCQFLKLLLQQTARLFYLTFAGNAVHTAQWCTHQDYDLREWTFRFQVIYAILLNSLQNTLLLLLVLRISILVWMKAPFQANPVRKHHTSHWEGLAFCSMLHCWLQSHEEAPWVVEQHYCFLAY